MPDRCGIMAMRKVVDAISCMVTYLTLIKAHAVLSGSPIAMHSETTNRDHKLVLESTCHVSRSRLENIRSEWKAQHVRTEYPQFVFIEQADGDMHFSVMVGGHDAWSRNLLISAA